MEELKGYWQYNGIYIPDSVYSVPCNDQVNSIDRDGIMTFMCSTRPNLSLQEYREKYAICNDGKWFYVVLDLSFKDLKEAIAKRQQEARKIQTEKDTE